MVSLTKVPAPSCEYQALCQDVKSCGERDKEEEGGNLIKCMSCEKIWLEGHFYEVLILQNFINLTCNCWWAARPSAAKIKQLKSRWAWNLGLEGVLALPTRSHVVSRPPET